MATQRTLVPHDDVIETLAPERANHAFYERILPGSTRRREHFLDTHLLHSTPGVRFIDPVTIPDNEPRPEIPTIPESTYNRLVIPRVLPCW